MTLKGAGRAHGIQQSLTAVVPLLLYWLENACEVLIQQAQQLQLLCCRHAGEQKETTAALVLRLIAILLYHSQLLYVVLSYNMYA